MTRPLKDYRPQHDEDCEIFMCSGGCGSTARACRVAGDGTCETGHKPCSCGLSAALARESAAHGTPDPRDERIAALEQPVARLQHEHAIRCGCKGTCSLSRIIQEITDAIR